jgi:predicted nucleotidyltransferase
MENTEKKIYKILEKNLNNDKYTYFLFGSRAIWNYKNNSDYDVWIFWDKKLNLKKYIRLKRELNDNIYYPINLVDFNTVWKSFSNIALKKIKLWNLWKNTKLIKKNIKLIEKN